MFDFHSVSGELTRTLMYSLRRTMCGTHLHPPCLHPPLHTLRTRKPTIQDPSPFCRRLLLLQLKVLWEDPCELVLITRCAASRPRDSTGLILFFTLLLLYAALHQLTQVLQPLGERREHSLLLFGWLAMDLPLDGEQREDSVAVELAEGAEELSLQPLHHLAQQQEEAVSLLL